MKGAWLKVCSYRQLQKQEAREVDLTGFLFLFGFIIAHCLEHLSNSSLWAFNDAMRSSMDQKGICF
jgi:hypothetical protein